MTLTFIEVSLFTRQLTQYFPDDEAFRRLQLALLADPERGSVIPGAKGIRKMRFRDPRRGKGTRGGLRVLYLHVPEAEAIILLLAYDKAEQDDLSAEQRTSLARLADAVRGEVLRLHSMPTQYHERQSIMVAPALEQDTKQTEEIILLSSLYDDLVAGLEEAAEHFRGEITLRTTTLTVSEVVSPVSDKADTEDSNEPR